MLLDRWWGCAASGDNAEDNSSSNGREGVGECGALHSGGSSGRCLLLGGLAGSMTLLPSLSDQGCADPLRQRDNASGLKAVASTSSESLEGGGGGGGGGGGMTGNGVATSSECPVPAVLGGDHPVVMLAVQLPPLAGQPEPPTVAFAIQVHDTLRVHHRIEVR
jgi:hypothetical protein